MGHEICEDLFRHADRDGSLAVGGSPPEVIAWLEAAEIPNDLMNLFRHSWPQKAASIGHLTFHTRQDLFGNRLLMKHKLLVIGNAPNGDLLAIRLKKDPPEIGIIDHDETARTDSPLDYYQPIATSLDSLLYRLIENRYVPMDYHAAKAFNGFLEEEAKRSSGSP